MSYESGITVYHRSEESLYRDTFPQGLHAMHVGRLMRKGSVYGGPEITLSGRRRRGSLAGRTASGVNGCMSSGALLSSDSSAWELKGAAH